MIDQVRTALQNFKYVVVGCQNCYSSPGSEKSALPSQCDDSKVALFLLAVEPGAFLLCNGWDDKYSLPLGLPKSAAKQNSKTGAWSRSFVGGTRVTWLNGTGTVHWSTSATVDASVV